MMVRNTCDSIPGMMPGGCPRRQVLAGERILVLYPALAGPAWAGLKTYIADGGKDAPSYQKHGGIIMGMVVRSNIMAVNANRQLGMNNSQVSKSLEKLSSGYKIDPERSPLQGRHNLQRSL